MKEIDEKDCTPEVLERVKLIKEAVGNYDLAICQNAGDSNNYRYLQDVYDLCYGNDHNLEAVSVALHQFVLQNAAIRGREPLERIRAGFELRERVKELRDSPDWALTHIVTVDELSYADGYPKVNYDPKSSIAGCNGKKSERPYVYVDEDFNVYCNLNKATVLLAEKVMDYTYPAVFIGLDGQPYENTVPMPWRRLHEKPWAGSTQAFVSAERFTSAVQGICEKPLPKKFIASESKADEGLPYIILDFGEEFGCAAYRYCELKMFFEAARYINAGMLLFADARRQLIAVEKEDDFEKDGAFVAVMPCLLLPDFEGDNVLVIEM